MSERPTANRTDPLEGVKVTATPEPGELIWVMPRDLWVSGITLTTLELALSLFSNILLMATIFSSPSLRTPPNVQLVSFLCNSQCPIIFFVA